MRRVIVAVDPGGTHTGIVIRSGETLHSHVLVTRLHPNASIDPYLSEVVDAVMKARDLARGLVLTSYPDDGQSVLAIEDIVDPTPQMGLMAIRGLIDTAQILGAVAARWAATRVPPAGHGLNPLHAYPTRLVGDLESKGTGALRHCRAAWDVAYHANTLLTVGASQ